MRNKVLLLLLALFVGCIAGGCSQAPTITEVTRTPLDTPEIFVVEGNTINCQTIENTEGFEIEYIYEDESRTYTETVSAMPYEVPCSDPGVYSVRVRALPEANTESYRSLWSEYIQIVSVNKDKITTPQNLRGEDTTIRWGNIKGAIGYQLDINGELVSVSENSYTSEEFLPGTEYKIKVRALIEDNIYTANSDWSKEYVHKYTVEFAAPTNVMRNSAGVFSWTAENSTVTGYTVSYRKAEEAEYQEVVVYEESFNMATLPSGDYYIKVKVNGVGDNEGSAYSDEKSVRITRCYVWTPEDILSLFTSWNNCTAALAGNNAAMQSAADWGGLISPEIAINYNRNPVLVIDYAKVNYGYMGKYLTANNENGYYYVGDTKGEFTDLTVSYLMSKQVNGSMPNAVGTQTGIRVLVGFAGAPTAETASRTVTELRGIYIAYVEEIV